MNEEQRLYELELIEKLRQQGHAIDPAVVDPDPQAAGFHICCVGCGRTARTTREPAAGTRFTCPPCSEAIISGASRPPGPADFQSAG